MDPIEPEPEGSPTPPAPPRSIPPLPPGPEALKASVPHVPLTPMMDFFQRRLEALERELELEKEKARSAQGQIQQQETLRGDVELHLKSMNEQLRREKAEREAQEAQSHARGRIDALEKRLDEMHQSWAALLKDAVTQRDSGTKAVSQDLTTVSATLASLLEQIGQWRAQTRAFAEALPELRQLSQDLPEGSRRFEGQVSAMMSQFSSELRERIAAWQRHQELEAERQAEKLKLLAQEREAMQRQWEEQNHALRQEQLKEKTARERELETRIGELSQRFSDMALSQQRAAADAGGLREELAKAIALLNTPPKAKDQVIAGLEVERGDLLKALQDRTLALHKFLDERRQIEKTMGESLAALHRDLDAERSKQGLVTARVSALELENARLKDELAMHGRTLAERDERIASMAAQRDELAKALSAESEKVRAHIEDRGLNEEAWRAKLLEAEKRVTAEVELRAKQSAAVAELKNQLATLTEHLTKALREKEDVAARHASFEQQLQKLRATIQEKDEMISMLNAAFQNLLKEP